MFFERLSSYLAPARNLIFGCCGWTEKEALVEELEELRIQLQGARDHASFQEQRVQDLTTTLESDATEAESLVVQVQHLTRKLLSEKERMAKEKQLIKMEKKNLLEEQSLLRDKLQEARTRLTFQAAERKELVARVKDNKTKLDLANQAFNLLVQSHENSRQIHKE